MKVARYVMAGLFIACLFPFFFFVISFYEARTLRDADESACNIHFAFVFQSFVIVVKRRTRVFFFYFVPVVSAVKKCQNRRPSGRFHCLPVG